MAKMNDPELHAMNVIRGAMEPLTDDQVRRVKLWILDRYGDGPPATQPKDPPELQPPEKEAP